MKRRSSVSVRAGQVLIGAVMLTVLTAGGLKLVDLPSFVNAVRTWSLIPKPAVVPVSLMVPTIEIMLAGSWFIGWARLRVAIGVVVMLALFTAFYVVHIALGERPDCGCAGVLARLRFGRAWATEVVTRNAVLVCSLGVGFVLSRRGEGAAAVTVPSVPIPSKACAPRGFTLIETILVVVVVALLMTLILPALGSARFAARAMRSNAQLRSHAAVFSAYNSDFKDFMPYVTVPDASYTILRASDFRVRAVYFEAVSWWNVGLAEQYYDGAHSGPVFTFPGASYTDWTPYKYSQAFLADPAYWRDTTRTGPAQWRATKATEVLHSSKKALLVDSASEIARRRDPNTTGGSPVGIAFTDGSVRNIAFGSVRRGYRNATGWEWHGCYNSVLRLGMHTIDGVRGRDVD